MLILLQGRVVDSTSPLRRPPPASHPAHRPTGRLEANLTLVQSRVVAWLTHR